MMDAFCFRWSEYGKTCILTRDLVVPVSKNALVLIDIHNGQVDEAAAELARLQKIEQEIKKIYDKYRELGDEYRFEDCVRVDVFYEMFADQLAAALEGKT